VDSEVRRMKMSHDKVMAHFRGVLLGPPTFWVPLLILPPISLRQAQISWPTSLERGGAYVALKSVVGRAVVWQGRRVVVG